MSAPLTVRITCPNCRQQYPAEVQQIIDAAKEPQLKKALLQGRLTSSVCPQCGALGQLNVPFLYHDASKSLFCCYTPMDMSTTQVQQQQAVGKLTNQYINSLPPEQFRGYMLQPKLYISAQTLIDDVMMADGLTREQIDARKDRERLLQELIQIESPEALREKVETSRERMDDTLFEILNSWIEDMQEAGALEMVQALNGLRDELTAIVYPEKAAADAAKAAAARQELLEAIIAERDPEKLRQIVTLSRPMIDYYFFMSLAERIEAAEKSGNEIETRRLSKLRESILNIMDELEAETRAALTAAAEFVRNALAQPNPEAFLRDNAENLDEIFFTIINLNISEAQRRNDTNTIKVLSGLAGLAIKILEEKAPPELRLLNRAMQTKPEERRALLEQEKGLLNDQFMSFIDQMGENIARTDNGEMAKEMDQIKQIAQELRG